MEIGNFYSQCGMTHLSSFYKWISAGRCITLREKLKKNNIDGGVYFKCLANRCANQMMSLFDTYKIQEQKAPSTREKNYERVNFGFPIAKKYLIAQLVELLPYNKRYSEALKFVKYMFHEMQDHLVKTEFDFCMRIFMSEKFRLNLGNFDQINEFFSTKFYRIPKLT